MHTGMSHHFKTASMPAIDEHTSHRAKHTIIGVLLVVAIIGALVVLGVYLTNRNGIASTASQGASQASSGNDVTISGKNGAVQASAGKKLPADFPLDHLTLSMGSVVNSSRVASGGNVAWTVVIETKDSFEKVKADALRNLQTGAWTVIADTKYGQNTMLVADKKDPVMRVVTNIAPKDDKIRIGYTLTKGGQTPKQ